MTRIPNRPNLWTLLALGLPLLAGIALYGYVLRLPFFMDDGLLFIMIKDYPGGVPGFRFWGGSAAFPYYRPLVFSIWEWQQMAIGRFDPFSLHALNLFLFSLGGSVLAALVRRLAGSVLAGVLAGLVFVGWPFSYNAVNWVASQFHVVMVFAVILTLWLALRWWFGGGIGWLLGVWLAAALALFSHENGVLLVPLLGLLLLVMAGPGVLRRGRFWRLLVPPAILTAVYLSLLLTVPRASNNVQIDFGQIPGSLAIMVQGIAYPLAALVRRLTGAEAGTLLLLGLAVAVILPGLAYLLWQRRRWALLAAYGVVWYGAASLPAVLFLPTDYIRGSWRLLLLASVGAAIFWGLLLAGLWRAGTGLLRKASRHEGEGFGVRANPRTGTRVLAVALAGVMLVVSVLFLAQRRRDALYQSAYAWALQDQIATHTRGAPLVVNPPAFLASNDADRFFLTTGMGVQFMAWFANPSWQFWAATGQDFPWVEALYYGQLLTPDASYMYATHHTYDVRYDGVAAARNATDIYITVFDGPDFYPVYVGGPGRTGPDTPLVQFPDTGISLTDARATLDGDRVQVTSRWRVNERGPQMPAVTLRCDGDAIATSTAAVWGGLYPFAYWQPGEVQTDIRYLNVPDGTAPGCLDVVVSIDGADGLTVAVE